MNGEPQADGGDATTRSNVAADRQNRAHRRDCVIAAVVGPAFKRMLKRMVNRSLMARIKPQTEPG
jgi:hypothetical protein